MTPPPAADDAPPVFVGGCERSGTSLVRALLGSHSAMAVIEYDLPVWKLWRQHVGASPAGGEKAVRKFTKALVRSSKFQGLPVAKEDPDIVERLLAAEPTLPGVLGAVGGLVAKNQGKARWALKVPYAEFSYPLIAEAFPNAPFLHVVRHPCDVVASMASAPWVESGLDTWLRTWRRSARLAATRDLPRYTVVRYEDVIVEPERTAKAVCDASGLPFEPEMLELRAHQTWRGNNSFFGDVSKGISRAPLERGASSLDPADRIVTSWVTRRERKPLGYPFRGSASPRAWAAAATRYRELRGASARERKGQA